MEQNIETKDVQRTEYLDKNGLDMLWAKVKENTNNQVEVERNRAVAKENSIIDTKADKSTLDNYVLTTALAEYAKKTDIPEVDTSNFVSKTITDAQSIKSKLSVFNELDIVDGSGADNYRTTIRGNRIGVQGYGETSMLISNSYLNFSNNNGTTLSLDGENSEISISSTTSNGNKTAFIISKHGIFIPDSDGNHVLTARNSTIDITQYAKKSDIAAGVNVDDVQVNGVSVIENKIANIKPATKESLGVVKIGDGLNVTDGTISVDKEFLIDMVSYGVEWDTTVADPACTRIGNMSYHKSLPIQSQYKGCLVKNGKVNYYLDPNDWSKKADGTPSVLDGTDGDVMVHIPKFYGKSGSNGNKRWVRIATTKIDSSWVEIPEMFVSAYCVTTYTDSNTPKVASVVNTTANYRGGENRADYDQYLSTDKFRTDLGKPRTNKSRATMRTMATNSGQELLCYEFYKWVFCWAYVIEYANFNSQKEFNSELTSDGYHQGGLGNGLTTWIYLYWRDYNDGPITPCGYTNEFGNFSGTKEILIPQTQIDDSTVVEAKTLYTNRWRGFENPFGDIYLNLDGIIINRDEYKSESKVYTTSDSSKFGEDISSMNFVSTAFTSGRYIDDYIREFDLGETGEIIPNRVYGSPSTYKCDRYNGQNGRGKSTLIVGGPADSQQQAGIFQFNAYQPVSYYSPFAGFRSVIRA